MDLESKLITIENFFKTNKFKIPRYQREYSWEKQQLEDFYKDIVSHIKYDGEHYFYQEYFFGTVILYGGVVNNTTEYLEIIDGQQRITTITIFLSALSDFLYDQDKTLSDRLWEYIIRLDDDGEPYTVMINETAYPYFQKKIQMRNIKPYEELNDCRYPIVNVDEIKDLESEKKISVEELNIKNAYDFFISKFEDENLCAPIFERSELGKVEKLKHVRNQLLQSTLIYINSNKKEDANTIFENINSKGVRLSPLDLIKNEIFSVDTQTIPLDRAKGYWAKIKENLRNNGNHISIHKFYKYFWISRYIYCSEKKLYKNFRKNIKDRKDYIDFLKELAEASDIFANIINPTEEYYRKKPKGKNPGKEELAEFVLSMKNLQDILKIEQVQVLLLSLVSKYKSGKIRFGTMKSIVNFLEDFHFVYNGILTERTNTLVNKYSKTAKKIYDAKHASEVNNIFNELKTYLIELLPRDNVEVVAKFREIRYSSKSENTKSSETNQNIFGKYVIYKLEELLSEENQTKFDRNSATIEHIISESEYENNRLVLNIGNLIILENKLNNECKNLPLKEKRKIYQESKYLTTKKFLEKYGQEEETFIEKRAREIGEYIYRIIINKWKNN